MNERNTNEGNTNERKDTGDERNKNYRPFVKRDYNDRIDNNQRKNYIGYNSDYYQPYDNRPKTLNRNFNPNYNPNYRNPNYRNPSFDPPTLSWNMTITNEPEAVNVTTSLAQVNIFLRTMPSVDHSPLLTAIKSLCEKHQLEMDINEAVEPWHVPTDALWVQEMLTLVGSKESHSVCFATDAGILQRLKRMLICGPGNIQQAHRSDEWIGFDQLKRGVEVFRRAFQHWACDSAKSD